jgi:hypothetical protein
VFILFDWDKPSEALAVGSESAQAIVLELV